LYQLLRLIDKTCGTLPLPLLKKSIFVGHYLAWEFYQDNRLSDGLNPYYSAIEEEIGLRVRAQEKRLAEICKFVMCAFDADGRVKQEEVLQVFVLTLPDGIAYSRIKTILQETYHDGDGFLSALQAMYQIHFVLALHENRQQIVLDLLNTLVFEEAEFGWLGNRLMHATLDGLFAQRQKPQVILGRLQSATDQCTSFLENALTASEVLRAKYDGRKVILAQIVNK